jgi:hypothetical protein
MATPSNGTPASTLAAVGDAVADINAETRDKYIKGFYPIHLAPPGPAWPCRAPPQLTSCATDEKVGEGTYAIVYRARVKATGEQVAIKKIKISSQQAGISMDSLREIKHLQELRHDNIVNLLDVFVGRNHNINAVLEFLAGDLEGIIKDGSVIYGTSDIKSWMAMSLRGLWWCHRNFVLHRVSGGCFDYSRDAQADTEDRILNPTTCCIRWTESLRLLILVLQDRSRILEV